MIKRILGVLMVLIGGFFGLVGVVGLLKVDGNSGSPVRDLISALIGALLFGGLCVFLTRTGMKWIENYEGVRKPDRVLKGIGILFVVVGGLVGLGGLGGLWENLVRFKEYKEILLSLLFFGAVFEAVCIFLIRVGLKWIKQA